MDTKVCSVIETLIENMTTSNDRNMDRKKLYNRNMDCHICLEMLVNFYGETNTNSIKWNHNCNKNQLFRSKI